MFSAGSVGNGAIVMVDGVLSKKPVALVARTMMFENVPLAVGVPDNKPAEDSVKPPGRAPLVGASAYVGAGVPLAT